MTTTACSSSGRAREHTTWPRKGGIVFVDGAPVIPRLEENIPFRFVFVDVGELLDEFAEVGGRNVKE